jgi:type II secretory pathway pseudopilin PulG
MSGEVEYDEPRGCPGPDGEASPIPSNRGDDVWSTVIAGGAVLALAGAFLVACAVLYSNRSYESPIDDARSQLSFIEKAAADYKTRHGDYPSSLDDLTVSEDGKPPRLEESDLKDPWGTPYRYNPRERSPSGRPTIFAVTPSGDEIRNWGP